MDVATRQKWAKRIVVDALDILYAKGQEYSVDGDVNGNFKRNAAKTGRPVQEVWFNHFTKHLDAIENYIKDPGRGMAEPVTGRIVDAINYLIILETLRIEGTIDGDRYVAKVGYAEAEDGHKENHARAWAMTDVRDELERARALYPIVHSYHHGLAVIQKQVFDLMLEVFKRSAERDKDRLRREAVQIAASAIRFIEELC